MPVDLLYSHPIWLVGSVIVALSILASWFGLYVFDRCVPVSIRREHNDVAGFIISIIGVVYAVLLAFVAVAAWEDFDSADNAVQREASLVGNLLRDCGAVEQPASSEMRAALRRYVFHVVGDELQAQQAGDIDEVDDIGWQPISGLQRLTAQLDAKTPGQAVIQAEILRNLNELYSARRARLLAAERGIPATIWWILILGSVITVGFSFFFGMPDIRMHYAMTGTLAASMALVMVLIVSVDRPFLGDDGSMITDAFHEVVKKLQPVPSP